HSVNGRPARIVDFCDVDEFHHGKSSGHQAPPSARANNCFKGNMKPGSTSPPSRTPSGPISWNRLGLVYTRADCFLGLISQTRRAPPRKYSSRLIFISRRVLPLLSTSTARSGTKSAIGLVGTRRFGNLFQEMKETSGSRTRSGTIRIMA